MNTVSIDALRQKRIGLINQNQKLLDTAAREKRDLNAEEAQQFEATNVLKTKTDVAIAEVEARMETERNMAGIEIRGDGTFGDLIGAGSLRPRAGKTSYRELFGLQALSTGGFNSAEEFYSAVFRSREIADPRLLVSSGFRADSPGQREAVPSDGGFAVPTQYAASIYDQALEDSVVMQRATIQPMRSSSLKIPAVDGFVHTSGILEGGLLGTWKNEFDTLALQKIKLRLIELNTNKLAILLNSSNELIDDGQPNFGNFLNRKLVEATGFFLDEAFLFGTGAGMPLGVFNDPALITVPCETGQTLAASPLTYANVCKMFARLAPACRKPGRAVWVVNSDLAPALLSMQLTVSNRANTETVGGSATPVLTRGPDGQFELLTIPVLFSEKMGALGNQDILLASFENYCVGLRLGLQLQASTHAGFTNDSTWFRAVIRCDGQGLWKSPIQPVNGQTLSWAVTLAKRS